MGTRARGDHQRVDTTTAAEDSFAAIGDRDLAGIEAGDRFAEGEGEGDSTVGHTVDVVSDGESGGDGIKLLRDLRGHRGLVAGNVGDTGGAEIDCDGALGTDSRGNHEGVNTATAAERSFCSIPQRHLAGIEPCDGLAEAEGEGDITGSDA